MQFRGNERSGALFSDGAAPLYRYLLWRRLSDHFIRSKGGVPRDGCMVWAGLNPSTADHEKNDPTCTREMGFTAREGYRKYVKWNVFALRSPDPGHLKGLISPHGDENVAALDLALSEHPAYVVAAWGPLARYKGADLRALRLLEIDERCGLTRLKCLRVTKDGFPGHPLYIPGSQPLQSFSPENVPRGTIGVCQSYPGAPCPQ